MDTKSDGLKRRKELQKILSEAVGPVSGTVLSGQLGVSRQVIVQDIALLRASHYDILSTPRGYILYQSATANCSRRYKVRHSSRDLEKEMQLIVDEGAVIIDVIIEHPIYGEIHGDLNLSSRRDIAAFMRKIQEQKGIPLLEMSDGYHYHTVEAETEEILDEIGQKLSDAGFLIS